MVAKFDALDDEPDKPCRRCLENRWAPRGVAVQARRHSAIWTVNRRAAGLDWKSSGRFGAGDQGLRCPPPWSMIRKSGHRFSLATNAKRLRGDHAQTKRQIGMTIRRSVIPILESQPDRRAGTASNTDGTERCEAQILGSPPSTIAPGRTYAGAAEGFASPGTISRDDRSGNQAPGVAHNHETRVRVALPQPIRVTPSLGTERACKARAFVPAWFDSRVTHHASLRT